MIGTVRLMVTVTVDGDYYTDTDDLARHVSGWIEAALDDRDGIDAYGPGLEIERVKVAQP